MLHVPLATLVADVLDNASGVLMMSLALGVVSAIAFAPLRSRSDTGTLSGLLIDVAIVLSLGAGTMYLGFLVRGPATTAGIVVYGLLVAAQAGWSWAVARAPTRPLMLAGLVVNTAALVLALAIVFSPDAAFDVVALALLEGGIVAACAVLLWPPSRQRVAESVVSATASAGGRAVAIAVVGMLVLLGLAGPGHPHTG